MIIFLAATPIAKKRPRFSRIGKHVVAYSDQKEEERKFVAYIKRQIGDTELLTGPLRINLLFGMPRPKSHFGTGRNAGKLKPSAPEYHTKKPDIDNLEKFVLDCLNGVVFKDDSQVVETKAIKFYDDVGSTEVQIYKAK